MNKTLTTIFALVGIFLCGAITGGVLAVRYVNVTVQKKAADTQLGKQQWVRMTDQLNPTKEQSEAIRALVTSYMEAQQTSRKIERDATNKLDEGIRALLTDVQLPKYEKLRNRAKENEKLWLRWIREQRSKHGESPLVAPKHIDVRKETKPKDAQPKPDAK